MSRRAVNRTLLAVVGLLLLAGGVLVLLGGLDVYRHLGVTPPPHWPFTSPDQPVLSTAAAPAGRTRPGSGRWRSPCPRWW